MSASVLSNPKYEAAPSTEAVGRIAAFVADETSESALRAGLSGIGRDLVLRRGNILLAIRSLEKENAPDAIVVDISGVDDPLSALERLSQVCPPSATVVVVGEVTDIGFYRLLVNDLGCAEYLPKPVTRDAVERLLSQHLAPSQAQGPAVRGGHVIAVCAAAGGAGATTIAVSTALELANKTKGNVALLDLNLQHGSASVSLGVRPGPGLRIALEDPDKADTLLLERSSISVAPRVRLIAADEPLGSGISITETGLRRVLGLVRQKSNFVVVDMPVPLRPELHQVLTLARHVVVVLKPDVASVRNAREIRQLAVRMAGSDRVMTVVNHADIQGGLNEKTLLKALDAPIHITIPNLGRGMHEAINLGVPAIRRVPELGRHVAPLIQEIGAVHVSPKPQSWLRRIIGR
jgi:pilus assembly protein CpaE